MIYRENLLNPQDFNTLRLALNLPQLPEKQLMHALNSSSYSVTAEDKKQIVGMARLLGDGALYWHIEDFIVSPEYQNQGVDKTILQMLIEFIKDYSLPDTESVVYLPASHRISQAALQLYDFSNGYLIIKK